MYRFFVAGLRAFLLCTFVAPVCLFAFTFTHPMTIINAEELAIVKSRIQAGTQPQKSCYDSLIRLANGYLSFSEVPPAAIRFAGGYDINRNQFPEANFRVHGTVAYTCALAWAYSGDSRYADKAIDVMNAWATPGTILSGIGAGLTLGAHMTGMMYAADLLHNYAGWDSAQRSVFLSWWRDNVLIYTNHTMDLMDNNLLDNAMLGVMSTAIVLEDEALYHKAVARLASYFSGSWKFVKDDKGAYTPREVMRNNGRSGLRYSAYSLSATAQALEMARYGGYNYWNTFTDASNPTCMREVIEQYWRWNYQAAPFPWGNPSKQTRYENQFELLRNNCAISSELDVWIKAKRPLNGADNGDEWITLNKGDMPVAQSPRIAAGSPTYIEKHSWAPISASEGIHQTGNTANHIRVFDARGRLAGMSDARGLRTKGVGSNSGSQNVIYDIKGNTTKSTRIVGFIR